MSSGFSGEYSDFFSTTTNGGVNNQQVIYRSPLPRSGFIGKRSLPEFQQQQQVYLRNVKPKAYDPPPPAHLLFSPEVSPEVSSVSNFSTSSPVYFGRKQPPENQEMERKMMNRLQELEKELLSDDDAVSVVTATVTDTGKPENRISFSPSPTTSSSSSCSSSSSAIPPNQLLSDAAVAITDGKPEIATELITRLNQISNATGSPEQKSGFFVASALQSRLNMNSTVFDQRSSSAMELYRKEHILSTQLLYDKSPCFKLAFMAANSFILQTPPPEKNMNMNCIHVVDFDIGHGLQYVYLIREIASAAGNHDHRKVSLKLTTFKDFGNGGFERLNLVGNALRSLANKLGVFFQFTVLDFKLSEITKSGLSISNHEILAVNFAFKLFKLPDESVSTENLRDDVLRRVKRLSPAVVTVAEQELNTNTATLTARVNDVFSYYSSLIDSLDATIRKGDSERVRIEQGLSRRIVNSVACEGRDRVERCEVFGKWRARMRMAGFESTRASRVTVGELMVKVNSGTRGNRGFTVKEDSDSVSFGWLGRTLTVVSAWK